MGILNVTPDSFSDGGRFNQLEVALNHVRQMVAAGARIIDVGGESTRPGAQPVAVQEELDRVIPLVEAISAEVDVLVSVDTSKPAVMQAAVHAGAGLINDVSALRQPGALEMAAALQVPVCLMHMQGQPRTMQDQPRYQDVVTDVHAWLASRIQQCEQAGIAKQQILIDPGFGFGKTLSHNLDLFAALSTFTDLGAGLLVGVSRKSMVGKVLDDAPADKRLQGSVALASLACWLGAKVVRVHDVPETMDAVRMISAVRQHQRACQLI